MQTTATPTATAWLESHAEQTPLAAHGAAKNRIVRKVMRQHLRNNSAPSLLPDDCPFDSYLGLRFYHQDPLGRIRQLCEEHRKRTAQSTVKFTDPEFPIQHTSTILHPSNRADFEAHPAKARRADLYMHRAQQWKWMRGSDMLHCSLFASSSAAAACPSICPTQVVQGGIGNCGVCSGLASLAAGVPQLLHGAFGAGSNTALAQYGCVTVRVYPQGHERYIVLDDYLLCKTANDCCSPSMHSSRQTDLWIRLLEKALCKIQGSYASLDGLYKYGSLYRHPARALQLLTGAPVAFELRYGLPVDLDQVFSVLCRTQDKYVRVVHCRKPLEGLHASHGYSLLWIGAIPFGSTRLVCLRNPHGRGSYRGKFGFGDMEWDSAHGRRVKEHLLTLPYFGRYIETGRVIWHTTRATDGNKDDGIFFMEFSTFVTCFPIATVVGPLLGSSTRATASVPDCVFTVPKSKLGRVCELLAAAETQNDAGGTYLHPPGR